ncbi:MAG: hypothetical protein DRG25_00530 [Deltaproteobacteria bacterium]|nr:MAG: hypothetical protein DRG25_00530 [Deltaproteobacteria bacterium]
MKKNLIISEEGAALVVCIIILAILSLMGAAAIMTTNTETKIAHNTRKSEQAFYAADAGIEDAWRRIRYEDDEDDDFEVSGDEFGQSGLNYQVEILGVVSIPSEGKKIFNVECRGEDPNTRSRRIIRAGIEKTRTRGRVDEGGYALGY